MVYKFLDYVPEIDGTCYLAPGCAVIGNVAVGRHSSIWHNSVLRGDIEKIIIGQNSNIQDNCTLHCTRGVELVIGDYVTVGHGAVLHSCIIGDNSLIGMGAVVLDGARIGRNSLVGAGAVVTPNTVIPEGSLALGSPAKVKRQLTEEEIGGLKANAEEYVHLAVKYGKQQKNDT